MIVSCSLFVVDGIRNKKIDRPPFEGEIFHQPTTAAVAAAS